MDSLPVLEGDGLRLRPLVPADAGAIFELFGDPEVVRTTSLELLKDRAQAVAFIDDIQRDSEAGTLLQWGIELDGAIVGTCTLAAIDRRHRRAELGFAVVRRMWGCRIASRVIPVVIGYAFGTLGLHRLEADADPGNAASIHVLERAGFTREGVQRERYQQLGEVQDAVVFGLLAREWRTGAE